jgi:hypothetical protein
MGIRGIGLFLLEAFPLLPMIPKDSLLRHISSSLGKIVPSETSALIHEMESSCPYCAFQLLDEPLSHGGRGVSVSFISTVFHGWNSHASMLA